MGPSCAARVLIPEFHEISDASRGVKRARVGGGRQGVAFLNVAKQRHVDLLKSGFVSISGFAAPQLFFRPLFLAPLSWFRILAVANRFLSFSSIPIHLNHCK